MIPKIIHYCWFGRGQMPDLAIRCIKSWQQYLPDYELKLWNEDHFDINSNQYSKRSVRSLQICFCNRLCTSLCIIYGGRHIYGY